MLSRIFGHSALLLLISKYLGCWRVLDAVVSLAAWLRWNHQKWWLPARQSGPARLSPLFLAWFPCEVRQERGIQAPFVLSFGAWCFMCRSLLIVIFILVMLLTWHGSFRTNTYWFVWDSTCFVRWGGFLCQLSRHATKHSVQEKTTQHIATGKYPINDKTSPKNNVPAVLNLQCCSGNVQVFLNLWLFLVYFVFTRLDKLCRHCHMWQLNMFSRFMSGLVLSNSLDTIKYAYDDDYVNSWEQCVLYFVQQVFWFWMPIHEQSIQSAKLSKSKVSRLTRKKTWAKPCKNMFFQNPPGKSEILSVNQIFLTHNSQVPKRQIQQTTETLE